MYSLIIPVYKNEASILELLNVLNSLNQELNGKLEVIFVIDGSPDQSFLLLEQNLGNASFASSVLVLSKNFGSYPAIRAGLAQAKGPYFAVMAADLQEPPELIRQFFQVLENEPYDVVVGTREGRSDPPFSRFCSNLFWRCYRRFVQKEVPPGGVDVFSCNLLVRDWLVALKENNSTLVGLLFWLGFRRKEVRYTRLARKHGKSAWTFSRKLRYLSDSMFAFSDLPIRVLIGVGAFGMIFSPLFGLFTVLARATGYIDFPGYTTTIFFTMFLIAFNAFGLGIIGSYVWRAFENSKQRPHTVTRLRRDFNRNETVIANNKKIPVNVQKIQDKMVSATTIAGVNLHRFPVFQDMRGSLSVGEFSRDIPFVPRRYFVVFNVAGEETRGEHAHKQCHQFLICVKGACSVVVDNGHQKEEIRLNTNTLGLHLPPMTWACQYKYTNDAALLVFASEYYDADDYIRDYDQYIALVTHQTAGIGE